MSRQIIQNRVFRIIQAVMPIFIIFTLCLYHIKDNQIIKICGDEFGYWAAGSWFAGYNWSEVQSINSYYGYGYGILLALFLKTSSSQITAYQLALFMNALMLCGMYFIAYKTVILLDEKKRLTNTTKMFIALSSILYTSNLYYTQFTMSETLLAFCYWLIAYNFLLLLNKFTFFRVVMFYLFAIISLSIHLRTIGVLCICIIFGNIILHKNRTSLKRILLLILLFVLSLLIVMGLKSVYQDSYQSLGMSTLNGNEISGQIGKLRYLLTANGIKTFFEGICGKTFYIINATFFLSIIPLYFLFKSLIRNIHRIWPKKDLKITNKEIFSLFLVLSTLSEIVIGSIFSIDYHGRFDSLTYGRYFEYTVTPLIVIGLIFLTAYFEKQSIHFFLVLVIFNLLVSSYTNKLQNYNTPKGNVFFNCTAFFETLNKYDYSQGLWLTIALKSIVILSILIVSAYFVKLKKSNRLFVFIILCMSILWVEAAKYTYEEGCLSWAIPFQDAEIELSNKIIDLGISDKLIFYSEGDPLKIMPLQYLLKNQTIGVEDDWEKIKESNNPYILLISANTKAADDLEEAEYELIGQSEWLSLWKKRK